MKRPVIIGAAIVAVISAMISAIAPALYAQEDARPVENAVRLFDGGDLRAFYTFLKEHGRNADPKGVFTVQDGCIRISGEEWGCLTSHDAYRDFHLIVEYKWGEQTWAPRADRARDSGVLVHSIGDDGGYSGVWMHSIECQMIEGGTGDFIVVGDGSDHFSVTCPVERDEPDHPHVYKQDGTLVTKSDGRVDWFARDRNWADVKGFRGVRDLEKPLGDWNRLECIADGDTLTVVLNGVVVNQAFNVRPSAGRIQIQSEAAELFLRRVELRPVDEPRPEPKIARQRRFIYNSDADNMLIYKDYPMTPADLYPYVDQIAGTQVTSLFMCPNFGMPMTYPTSVGDLIGEHVSPELAKTITPAAGAKTTERGIMNIRSLIAAGGDPTGFAIDRAREKGLEGFVSFRLNEVHAVEQDDSLIFSRFWKEHPEWRLGKAGDPLPAVYLDILGPNVHPVVASWLPGGLNFAVPEVRAHVLALLRECCERFNLDGLELDFQRFPMYFKPGEEAAHTPTMTAWIREIRAMTTSVGDRRGRPIQLCARIMARPEQNTAIGLDPVAWAEEGLLDFVVVSHYLRNDYPLPVRAYRELLPAGTPIYGSIEVAPDAAGFRRVARQLWADGVDGIYLFNFFTTREGGKEPPNELLRELGQANTIAGTAD